MLYCRCETCEDDGWSLRLWTLEGRRQLLVLHAPSLQALRLVDRQRCGAEAAAAQVAEKHAGTAGAAGVGGGPGPCLGLHRALLALRLVDGD